MKTALPLQRRLSRAGQKHCEMSHFKLFQLLEEARTSFDHRYSLMGFTEWKIVESPGQGTVWDGKNTTLKIPNSFFWAIHFFSTDTYYAVTSTLPSTRGIDECKIVPVLKPRIFQQEFQSINKQANLWRNGGDCHAEIVQSGERGKRCVWHSGGTRDNVQWPEKVFLTS